MTKHREEHREKVFSPGSVEFDGKAYACTIHNLSKTGAMIKSWVPVTASAIVVLTMFDGTRKDCRVVWRREQQFGLEFQ